MSNDGIDNDDIDLSRLELECARQEGRFRSWSEKLAEARKDYDLAERRLDVAKAQAGKEFRADPASAGFDKATDATTKDAVTLNKKVDKAERELIEARYAMGIVQAKVNGLDQRKRMIEKAVDLWAKEYFSTPKKPKGEVGEKLNQMRSQAAFGRQRGKDD